MIDSNILLPQISYCIQIFKNPPSGMKDVAKLMNAHALFLEQPTELWMWLPCDEKGEILKEPFSVSVGADTYVMADDHDTYNEKLMEYNAAKARCLFHVPVIPADVEMVRYLEGICMHCYCLDDVINANFKLKLKSHVILKLFYGD